MCCGGRVLIKAVGRLGGAKGLTEDEIARLPGYVVARPKPWGDGKLDHQVWMWDGMGPAGVDDPADLDLHLCMFSLSRTCLSSHIL